MHDIFEEFVQFLATNGYSVKTIENYSRGVGMFNKFLLEHDMNYNCGLRGIEQWKNTLSCNEKTANLYIHAVRKLYFYLNYVGLSQLNPKNILCLREHNTESDYITKDEMNKMLNLVEGSELSIARNKCIIKFLWETGLRVSELTSVKWSMFERDGKEVGFKVIGKGKKERVVFISQLLVELLLDYRMQLLTNGINSLYVFCSIANNSKGGKLSRNSIEKIIEKLNFTGKHLTPHSFRHGMATHALQQGCNIVDLQKTLGHSNLTTTSNYLHSSYDRVKSCQKLCW